MHVKVVLLTFSVLLLGVQSTVTRCNGISSYEPCCVGERWNSAEGKCVDCPFDHYGENCTFTCSVPEEGYRCTLGECKCSRVSCNVTITSQLCSTPKVPVYISKSVDVTLAASSLHVENSTANSISSSSSSLSSSSSSGNLLRPMHNKKKWGTVYIILIVLGVCLLFLIGLGVMDRVRVVRTRITKSRQEIPEPSYCEIKDVKLTIL